LGIPKLTSVGSDIECGKSGKAKKANFCFTLTHPLGKPTLVNLTKIKNPLLSAFIRVHLLSSAIKKNQDYSSTGNLIFAVFANHYNYDKFQNYLIYH